jgi:RNA polymerase sigma-70 factor (ECF subfamily)
MSKPAAAHPSSNEADLVARARQGDAAAVRRIIRQHNQRLYRIARSIVRDDGEAEDVLQDAYARAFTNLTTFRGEARLGTWLARIVMHEALGRLRGRRPTVELDAAIAGAPAAESAVAVRAGGACGGAQTATAAVRSSSFAFSVTVQLGG